MYSVFLVEDEIVTREGIRNCIAWENTPYTFAGEAPDGELALHALREIKPDILITDIKMPFMNGLDLARIIRKDQPWIKIIILSGHDEFKYAREAISIGVEEYLLKPVSSADMLGTLDKVVKQIEAEKNRITSIENLKKKVESSEDIIREKWLGKLITGQLKSLNAIETAATMNVDLLPGGYAVMEVELTSEHEDYSRITIAKKILSSITAAREEVVSFSMGIDKQILLIKNLSPEADPDMLYSLAQGIKFEIERNTDCSTAVAIGPVVGYISEIVRSYKEADRAVKYMRMTGKKIIIGSDDMRWSKTLEQLQTDNDPVTAQLRFVETEEIDDLLNQLFRVSGTGAADSNKPDFYRLIIRDIGHSLYELIKALNGSPADIISDILDDAKINEAIKSGQDLHSMLSQIISNWIFFRDTNVHKKHSSKILKAKNYISENFMSQDISLNSVASFVNVSPNHFSTIFSQEVGETFIEHLTGVRISRAKELLLNSSMKCSDITYEVGYSDPHYFSFIFKKNTGVSPSEFRQEASAGKI